jgi:putative ABC transport system permease protein
MMPSREVLRIARDALTAHKLRSVLTALGIVMSVWTIVSVMSVISGLNDYVNSKVIDLSPDVFLVDRFGIIQGRDEFFAALKRKAITDVEVAELRNLCHSCAEVGQQVSGNKDAKFGDRRIPDVPIQGATPNLAVLTNIDIEAGRFFTDSENEHRDLVAVIGAAVREELFPRVDPLGRTLLVAGLPHKIIGLIRKQGTVLGENPDLVVYVPYRTAGKYLAGGRFRDRQMSVFVRAEGGVAGTKRAQEEAIQVFRWLRNTPFKAADPVAIISAEQVQQLWRSISFTTFFIVILISLTSLVVGAIVVANIMLVAVVQRTREIGIRLALGARKRDVRRQFLVEAALLGIGGGIIGASLGAVTAMIVNDQTPVPALARGWIVASGVLVALLTGVLAGFFPARRASNLPPVEALRHE